MKPMQRNAMMLALAAALAMPATLMAADAARDEHSGHHPEQAAASAPAQAAQPDRMQAMRARMMEIRASKDPGKRKQLMEAQMKDMEALMQDGSCPMMAGGMGGMGGMGMMGKGVAGADDTMARRMDMMEKRMDMMQMMMQKGMGQSGGMGPGK